MLYIFGFCSTFSIISSVFNWTKLFVFESELEFTSGLLSGGRISFSSGVSIGGGLKGGDTDSEDGLRYDQ